MYGQRSTEEIIKHALETEAKIVDMRSDTISKPTLAMRQAIFDAELGDDVYEEDPTVKRLEEKSARLLGKEAAIFVSTGTMGNLISVLNHCTARDCKIYCGADSHIALYQQDSASQIGRVTVCTLPNRLDGTFNLAELESKIRNDWRHEPFSRMVAVENTINGCVVPREWIDKLAAVCRKYKLRMHLDGARLWNASVASGLPVSRLVEHFDSVTFCLSKGLGAPVGSVLSGSAEFVRRARRARKVLGGGMRQVGILAAAGIVALDEIVPLLKEDHRRAKEIAKIINECDSPIFSVDLATTHTNMVMIRVDSSKVTAREFIARLQLVKDEDEGCERVIVRGLALTKDLARLVLYYGIDDDLKNKAISKIMKVIYEFDKAERDKC